MTTYGNPRRGSALLLSLVIALVVFALAFAAILASSGSMRTSGESWEYRQALYAAEAGYNHALQRLNAEAVPGVLDSGTIPETPWGPHGSYRTEADAAPAFQVILKSVGTESNVRRGVEVVLAPGVGLGLSSAFSLFGKPDDVTFHIEPGSRVFLSGLPGSLPALAFEDQGVYETTMEQIAAQLISGEIGSSTFRGEPETTYTTSGGDTVTEPIVQYDGLLLDASLMEQVRQAIVTKTTSDWIPSADVVLSGTQAVDTDVVYGSPGDPQVVVIDGSVDIQANASIRGYGTLIVTGGLDVEDRADLIWDGNVIVIGGGGDDAALSVQGGSMNIQGNLYVVGAADSGAELVIDHPTQENFSANHVNIQGSMVALGGDADEYARIVIDDGTTQIRGMMIIEGGTSAELKLGSPDDPFQGVLNVLGAVAVGTSGSGGSVNVDLAGNMNLTYHRKNYRDALNGFNAFVRTLGLKLPYVVEGWREYAP